MKFPIKNTLSILLVSALTFTISESSLAQNSQQGELTKDRIERLEESLAYGLSSEVSGVVKSALFNAISYKVEYPDFESDKVLNEVKVISESHPSDRVQSKAALVLNYYQNGADFPEQSTLLAELDNGNQDRIFDFLQRGINSGQFTSTQE